MTAFSIAAIPGWSLGFNDLTPSGYVITVGYLIAVGLCVAVLRNRSPARPRGRERYYWITFLGLYGALGINKQLDLQTLLIALVRQTVHRTGWSRPQQLVVALLSVAAFFVLGLCVAGLLVGKLLAAWRNRDRVGGLALTALVILVAFLVLRAAMYFHFIRFYSTAWNLLHVHRLIEFASVCLVAAAAWERLRLCRN